MQFPRQRRPEFEETRIYEYPQHLREAIDDLPAAPGVYIFHGEEGDLPLYIGKSVSIRSRVLSHLRNPDEARMLRQTRRITHICTAGEIGALLLEASMIKQQQPLLNQKLRRNRQLCSLQLVDDRPAVVYSKVDNARQGARWNQNQDLIGQGLAKVASGLNGAFPTSSSFSRSALNLYAGARSDWATLFAVVVVAMSLQWFLPTLHHVPQSVLAAIVIVAVMGLIKPAEFVRLWRVARVEAVIALLTFAATVLASPQLYWGVLFGVLLALTHFLYGRLHPRIIEVGLHADGRLRDRHIWNLPALAPNILAVRMDAALDFGSAHAMEQAIGNHLSAHPDTTRVLLFAQSINHIDATGVETFVRLRQHLVNHKREWWVIGLKLPVEVRLKAAEALAPDSHFRCIASEMDALIALNSSSTIA